MNDSLNKPSTETQTNFKGRAYVLGLLTLVYTFNHVDRQILVTLLEPIKQELHLKDSQLGLLTGLAFAAFYATLGIPVAMWADRGNRRNIIALALTVWSAMTAVSGFAQNFMHLLIARMGVGVGEAGGTPPATSIIADLYPPKQRAMALGIYTSGIGLGIMIGYVLAAEVYAHFGWRIAFFVAGVPGLLLALLVRFTMKEPKRGLSEAREQHEQAPSLKETLAFIGTQKSLIWLLLGCLMICISANAYVAFISSHLQRSYNLTVMDVALPLGLLIGVVGSFGAIVLGNVCDRLSAKDLRWRPWMIGICSLVALPFAWMFLGAETVNHAYMWNIVPCFVGLIYASIAYTSSQELVPLQMRSFASAFTLFCLTLIGIGGGPLIAGSLSDYFAAQGVEAPLTLALRWILIFNAASIICFLFSGIFYRSDVKRASEA
ncbi:spinster family MFS transporter [Hirschia baltica]|uniref:Major facilitator superfamily MFS_1 n=1 Tax=Hirschia baltica (strain ATCC 49814 / DSM 5838 / IFAM 1418) TaxID=582402 RepID=C6XJJ2_HIRBI|nr:MFS transporter [Hirschia baltica]ACT59287.1 major facilitator superfamily MFS_1 [Hirschia baltica ATCC 49814]